MNNSDCHKAVQDLKDDKVPGLQLRVRATGKSFYLYYRRNGQQRRPKIGDFPGLTVAEAREIAQAMLRDVAAGLDPSEARRETRKIHFIQHDLARRRRFETRQHSQQRGFPTARGAQQSENLAPNDIQADRIDGPDTAKFLDDFPDLQEM